MYELVLLRDSDIFVRLEKGLGSRGPIAELETVVKRTVKSLRSGR